MMENETKNGSINVQYNELCGIVLRQINEKLNDVKNLVGGKDERTNK